MTQFAAGQYAFGFCDRCGFRYGLHDLKPEIVDMTPSGFLVCPECLDQDQPQYQLGDSNGFHVKHQEGILDSPRVLESRGRTDSLFRN